MALDADLRSRLTLPAICAPMFLVTGPALVREACKAGLIGGLPRQNARSVEEFEAWLNQITSTLAAHTREDPTARIAPIARIQGSIAAAPRYPLGPSRYKRRPAVWQTGSWNCRAGAANPRRSNRLRLPRRKRSRGHRFLQTSPLRHLRR